MATNIIDEFIAELEEEGRISRKCVEKIPVGELWDYKPHEKSMQMGYLAVMCADIPNWITYAIKEGEVDFKTYPRFEPKTAEELAKHLDQSLEKAVEALKNMKEGELLETFSLKNDGQLLATDTKKHTISSTLNHWVHHRGQLTVYMRLNNIPVPSIYGPSADETGF